jgi:hypothetical protein
MFRFPIIIIIIIIIFFFWANLHHIGSQIEIDHLKRKLEYLLI